MILTGLHEAMFLVGEQCLAEDTVEKILARVYPNRSFPTFIGMRRSRKPTYTKEVWEDVVAGVNWNAQLFEYLTRIVDEPSAICVTRPVSSNQIGCRRFFYLDTRRSVAIVSWWPPRSLGVYIMGKLSARAWFSFNPCQVLGAIKSRIRKVFWKAK